MNNQLIEKKDNNIVSFDDNKVTLIKNTVAKGATDDELQMFLHLAGQYNLDPFKKEIWFMKYGGQTTIMTSRDGYLKYAQMNKEFKGLISFVIKEGDIFEIDASEYKVTHKFGIKRGNIIGAWARCDREGKKPFITYVDFQEYNKNTNIWRTYPSAMIQKVAEAFVLKRAFGINGLVTNEEIGLQENPVSNFITIEQAKAIFEIVGEHQDIVKQVLNEYKLERTNQITNDIYLEFYDKVYILVSELEENSDILEEENSDILEEENSDILEEENSSEE